MKDPDRSVRRRASLLALGLEGETARRLGEEAIHDTDPEVRGLAALALGAASGEGARTLLLEALNDPETRVRKAAAQSLSRILGQDVSPVVALDDAHRRREVRRLATLPVRARARHPRPEAAAPAPGGRRSGARRRPRRTARPRRGRWWWPGVRPPAWCAMVASPRAPAVPAAPARPRRPRPRPGPPLRWRPCARRCCSTSASAIRGRSMAELATGLSTAPELAQEALALLVARGMVVRQRAQILRRLRQGRASR